jgi:hypothetical protein
MCSRREWSGDLGAGLLTYLLTSAPVWLGVLFGIDFVPYDRERPATPKPDFLVACSQGDGRHYAAVVQRGYSYDPLQRSTVAFFPGYPLLAGLATQLTGCDAPLALLVTANVMLLGAFVIFSAYLRSRWPEDNPGSRFLVLALFGLWPAGFFFRMAYSESTFLFFTILVLWGMVRRWPLLLLAFFSGLITAVRPVGLAVTLAFEWYVLSNDERGSLVWRSLLGLALLPLAVWGLLAYVGYQAYRFDAPLAFAQTQEHWSFVAPAYADFGHKLESLLAGEPIWGVYTSDPVLSWNRMEPHGNPLFNLFFWNPILFVLAFVLVLWGAAKSWLSGPEILLGLGLLAIPYVTRAYEMSMASQGRFAAIVLPAYVVLGRLLRDRPDWLKWSALGTMAVMLMAWSALFAAGYPFF